VARIANDRGLAETIRSAGQRTVTQRFLIDRNADEFLRLLDHVPHHRPWPLPSAQAV
jgi:hypothetical protein